jgi:hypothetical protein
MTFPRWIGPGALAFLALWLLFLAAGRSDFLRDPGTFWHVTTGEIILDRGFIREDPYTFTFAGTWWVPYQWLGEVVMALGHRAAGFDALLLGAVTVLAGTFAWLFVRLLRTGLNPVLCGAVVGLAVAASASHFHVRPHLFTMLMMAVTAVLLVDADAGRTPLRRLLWLVPMCAVWANVHGGVLGGIATVGLTAGGWVVFCLVGLPTPVRTGRDAVFVLAVALGCGLATLVNPYGLDLLKTWHVIMGEPALKHIVQEHSAFVVTEPYAWPVLGFAALYGFVLAGVSPRQMRVSWLLPLVWLVLAFDRVRHIPLFAIVGLVALAAIWPHTRWAARLARTRPDVYDPAAAPLPRPWLASVWLPATAVLAVFMLQVCRVEVPVVGAGWARHSPQVWPVELLGVLKEYEPRSPGEPNRLFNDYVDGGFVIYHAPGYKVFVDDRCEVFGGEWLTDFVKASGTNTAAAIGRWEGQYGRFAFALTRTGTGFDDYFRTSPDWQTVKRTDTATFYKRK